MPVQRWHVFRVGQKRRHPGARYYRAPSYRLTGLRSFELQVLTLDDFRPQAIRHCRGCAG